MKASEVDEPSAPPAESAATSSTNFDGSLDAIYKSADEARTNVERRGAAEGEDFDFCCPSPADDLFGRVSYREKGSAASDEDGNGADEAEESKGPLEGLLNMLGF